MSRPMPTVLIALSLMTGCASSGAPSPGPTARVDRALLAPCPDPPQLRSGATSEHLRVTVALARIYWECKTRHQGLAETVRSMEAQGE